MKYKCILFDCDGVLVDTEAISVQVLCELSASLGLQLEFNHAIEVFTGLSLISCFQYIQNRVGVALPSDFEQRFRKRTFELFERELTVIPGIHEVIENLQVPFCVASSGPQHKIALNLKLTGLYSHFEGNIFSCFDLQKWKPDPAIFLHAAKTMGFKPEECVVIEDSVPGVKAAIAGGFDVYALATPHTEERLSELGANLFYTMKDLLPLLSS